ncbi:MAG: GAF domain-containing protein [Microcoleus sp. PH2017_10_PVI_O_A]|uniref:ATP-binding protein n=1 Tax=unclassified Microcoleus TaxID=2642155 RepID=UPI001D429AE5|nr:MULTISPECIES: ATP-binding protein [unclassified Microcoleus]TAE81568.1 MAG: GAF domain-containing protein [Oscillatoriales cyanobacterium]MCC3404918.1 GAF domain-containing protein [Microcoleus sp. PH2017_10_PVI_O_A]MCC3461141.1 GAF domain-containing protein [Microcoleus sp. PH2017_11_PCY_U_A]MCC3479152.1 GAF domain-containing protein [Microcoleus sp. PH2017_12_PCY_D_A]MCC3527329.1 GAF domain-containing protein [Microcoleus sp. PH2017_21_RUC_O_A]
MIDEVVDFTQTVDLTNCDREPIQIPGLIQPHGVLLVLQEPDLKIVQVSNNTLALLGQQPQELLGKPLLNLLAPKQINAIRQCLSEEFEYVNPLDISVRSKTKLLHFDGIVHRCNSLIILELEQKKTRKKTNFLELAQGVKGTITKIQKAPTLLEMCGVVVKEVRKITGFDRVMVYQLDAAGAGRVIAEDRVETLTPYLGLHYPPSDIPQQARQLYILNWLRLIPDSSYEPVALVPAHNPLESRPTDLSLSVLRSVSPVHLEYLNNMGVSASMSISLIQDQKLWGLIACHHSTPNYVPYSVRTMCEFVGQVMSIELASKEDREDLDYKMTLKSLQSKFVESLSQSKSFWDGLVQLNSNLLELVGATGVAVCAGEQVICIGETPPEAEIPALRKWIKTQIQHNLFQTRSLSEIYPTAESFKAVASGLLALEISQVNQNYIFWFRPEVIQTVNWGGNPNKPVEVTTDGEMRLSPRKSFELWQETVQGTSLPWKSCEIETVTELRSLIVGIILSQADEMAKINLELQRSNTELDAFAYVASHDLKEPLRGIHNYSNFLIEDYGDVLHSDGIAKLQTLVRLTQRMEDLINSLLHYSRLGRTELSRQPTNLNDVVRQSIDILKIGGPQQAIEFRTQTLPTVACDRTQVSELFLNLISNAIKYNDKTEKWVEIGAIESEAASSKDPGLYTFYVRDNGIGIPQKHWERVFQIFKRLHAQDEYGGGTGAGLTIVQKIVDRHGGKIWVESTLGEGSTFYFTLSGR